MYPSLGVTNFDLEVDSIYALAKTMGRGSNNAHMERGKGMGRAGRSVSGVRVGAGPGG